MFSFTSYWSKVRFQGYINLSSRSDIISRIRTVHSKLLPIFILAFLVIGCLFSFLSPPFRAPDEPAHWTAATLRYSEGVGGGNCGEEHGLFQFLRPEAYATKPSSSVATGRYRSLGDLQSSCAETYIWYGNSFTYYGVRLAHILKSAVLPAAKNYRAGDAALYYYYASRFLQGLVVLGLLTRLFFLTRKSQNIPLPGVLSLFAVSLSPIFVQQSYAVTSDTILIAGALAIVNVFVAFPSWSTIDLFLAISLGFLAGSTKPVFVPAFAAAFGVFSLGSLGYRLSSLQGKRWIKSKEMVLLMSVVALSLFVFLDYSSRMKANVAVPEGVDPKAQLAFLLKNPFVGFAIVQSGVSSFLDTSALWVGSLGWFDFSMSSITEWLWTHLYRFVFIVDVVLLVGNFFFFFNLVRERFLREIWPRLLGLGVGFLGVYLMAFLSSLSMYLYWSKVGQERVDGVQFRYFLPCTILTFGYLMFLGRSMQCLDGEQEDGPPETRRLPNKLMQALTVIPAVFLGCYLIVYVVSMSMDFLKRYY